MCRFRLSYFCRHMKIEVAVVKEIVKMLQRKVKYISDCSFFFPFFYFFFFFGGGGGGFMSIFTFSGQSFNESLEFCNRS